jgi:hypothetical protein
MMAFNCCRRRLACFSSNHKGPGNVQRYLVVVQAIPAIEAVLPLLRMLKESDKMGDAERRRRKAIRIHRRHGDAPPDLRSFSEEGLAAAATPS